MSEERRVAIAGFNGCLKAKAGEFCLPCVVQATGYAYQGESDRRRWPHDYTTNTGEGTHGSVGSHVPRERMDTVAVGSIPTSPDTSAVELVRELVKALDRIATLENEIGKIDRKAMHGVVYLLAKRAITKADEWLKKQGV